MDSGKRQYLNEGEFYLCEEQGNMEILMVKMNLKMLCKWIKKKDNMVKWLQKSPLWSKRSPCL